MEILQEKYLGIEVAPNNTVFIITDRVFKATHESDIESGIHRLTIALENADANLIPSCVPVEVVSAIQAIWATGE